MSMPMCLQSRLTISSPVDVGLFQGAESGPLRLSQHSDEEPFGGQRAVLQVDGEGTETGLLHRAAAWQEGSHSDCEPACTSE